MPHTMIQHSSSTQIHAHCIHRMQSPCRPFPRVLLSCQMKSSLFGFQDAPSSLPGIPEYCATGHLGRLPKPYLSSDQGGLCVAEPIGPLTGQMDPCGC